MVSHFANVIFVIIFQVSIVVGSSFFHKNNSFQKYGNENWSKLIHRVMTIEDPYDSSYMVGNSCVIGTNCVDKYKYINFPNESGVEEDNFLKKKSNTMLRGSVPR